MNVFQRLVEWFLVYHESEDGSELRRRGRVTVGFSLLFLPLIPVSTSFYWAIGIGPVTIPLFVAGGVLVTVPWIVRYTKDSYIGANILLMGLMVCVGEVAVQTGGIASPILWWVLIIPWTAGASLGTTGNLFWSLVGAVELAVVDLIREARFGGSFSFDEQSCFVLGTLYLLLVTMVVVSIYVERNRRRVVEELEFSNGELRRANQERQRYLDEVAAEQRRTEDALERAQMAQLELAKSHRVKSEVLRMAGHDLRSPLSEIVGAVELIRDSSESTEVREFIGYVTKSCKTMRELLDAILSLERLEAGGVDMELNELDPTDVFLSTVGDFTIRAQAKRIKLVEEISESRPILQSDANMLRQIFQNLISNALKYSPSDTAVTVRQWVENGSLNFEVRDRGMGIPQKDRDKLFTPFARLTNQPTDGETSSGIGLAIVSQLAVILGAKISYESVVGVGTSFFVRLKAQ